MLDDMIEFVGFARRLMSDEHGGSMDETVFMLCDGTKPEIDIYAVILCGETPTEDGGLIFVGASSYDDWYIESYHPGFKTSGGMDRFLEVLRNRLKGVEFRPDSFTPSLVVRKSCGVVIGAEAE